MHHLTRINITTQRPLAVACFNSTTVTKILFGCTSVKSLQVPHTDVCSQDTDESWCLFLVAGLPDVIIDDFNESGNDTENK